MTFPDNQDGQNQSSSERELPGRIEHLRIKLVQKIRIKPNIEMSEPETYYNTTGTVNFPDEPKGFMQGLLYLRDQSTKGFFQTPPLSPRELITFTLKQGGNYDIEVNIGTEGARVLRENGYTVNTTPLIFSSVQFDQGVLPYIDRLAEIINNY